MAKPKPLDLLTSSQFYVLEWYEKNHLAPADKGKTIRTLVEMGLVIVDEQRLVSVTDKGHKVLREFE